LWSDAESVISNRKYSVDNSKSKKPKNNIEQYKSTSCKKGFLVLLMGEAGKAKPYN
jgi:hypothetical protein